MLCHALTALTAVRQTVATVWDSFWARIVIVGLCVGGVPAALLFLAQGAL